MDSALCVYKTARVVGSHRVTRVWKQTNESRAVRTPVCYITHTHRIICLPHCQCYVMPTVWMVNGGNQFLFQFIWIYISSKWHKNTKKTCLVRGVLWTISALSEGQACFEQKLKIENAKCVRDTCTFPHIAPRDCLYSFCLIYQIKILLKILWIEEIVIFLICTHRRDFLVSSKTEKARVLSSNHDSLPYFLILHCCLKLFNLYACISL